MYLLVGLTQFIFSLSIDFCMTNFVKPYLLGTKEEFVNRFYLPIENGPFQDSRNEDVSIMKQRSYVLHRMLDGIVQVCCVMYEYHKANWFLGMSSMETGSSFHTTGMFAQTIYQLVFSNMQISWLRQVKILIYIQVCICFVSLNTEKGQWGKHFEGPWTGLWNFSLHILVVSTYTVFALYFEDKCQFF